MALRIITPPVDEPVTLAEAKAHLRVVDNDDDLLIGSAIVAGRRHSERFMGRLLITQTWELVIDEFPLAEIRIPNPPLIAVESIKYDDGDGVEQTLAAASYDVDTASEPGWVVPVDTWPSTIEAINAVRIRYIAGYAPTADSPADLASGVPYDIKAAILLYVGNLYNNRETMAVGTIAAALPWGAEQLLRMHRVDLWLGVMLAALDRNRAATDGPALLPWWQDWRGQACAIVASGASTKAANVAQIAGRIFVLAIKENAVDLCPWADVVYGCDRHWWNHRQGLPTFHGLKLAWDDVSRWPDIKRITIKDKMCDRILTDHPGVIGSGGNSGFQAVNIAAQFGVARMLLIGFDVHGNGGLHWYGRNRWPKGNNPSNSNFRRWRKSLDDNAQTLRDLGVEVLNASPTSALTKFDRVTVAQALEKWGL